MFSIPLYQTPFGKTLYETAKDTYLNQLSGSVKLLRQANLYIDSNLKSEVKSVIHIRDLFIGLALSSMLDNVMLIDGNNLSPHSRHTRDYQYPVFTGNSDYSGELGTLAYYMQFVDNSSYPIDYIDRLLSHLWLLHGSDYTVTTPKQRLDNLLRLLSIPLNLDSIVKEAVSFIFTAVTQDSELYPTLLFARRNYIVESDAENFTYKVLTGTYNKNILILLEQKLSRRKMDLVNAFISSVESVARPSGIYLLLQSFTTESYLNIAKLLSELSDNELIQNSNVILTEQYDSLRQQIVSYFILARDGLQSLIEKGYINKESERNMIQTFIQSYLKDSDSIDVTNSLQDTLFQPQLLGYERSDFSRYNTNAVLNVKSKVNSQTENLIKGYTLINTVSQTEIPRGTRGDFDTILGLSLPKIGGRDADELAEVYTSSAQETYASLMLGFMTDQEAVHGSEISVLEEWLKALPI